MVGQTLGKLVQPKRPLIEDPEGTERQEDLNKEEEAENGQMDPQEQKCKNFNFF